LEYAALAGDEGVLELYGGVGWLTAFLAPRAGLVATVEPSPDAVADAAVNLDDTENVMLYEGEPAAILPQLEGGPDVAVIHAGDSLPRAVVDALRDMAPARIVYLSEDAALLARDARTMEKAGFTLQQVQPIDMYPQNYQVYTVSLFESA
jgi:23S rRNA (uracil1939-C5)-methyltransferase